MGDFTASDFCKAFLSELVLGGNRVIQPKSAADRRGFRNLVKVLDIAAQEAASGDRAWYKQVVRLRNSLQTSNNGSFEGFETTLRDLQTSSVLQPNPNYEFLKIDVSPSFAQSIIDGLEDRQRILVHAATRAFDDARQTRALAS
jgi:hypothetical protein